MTISNLFEVNEQILASGSKLETWYLMAEWWIIPGQASGRILRCVRNLPIMGKVVHHTGYVIFHQRDDLLVRSEYEAVDVHGGVTFAKMQDGKPTYGFDTDHVFSRPHTQDMSYLRDECLRLYQQIEELYRNA